VAYVAGIGSDRGVYVQPFPATGAKYQVTKNGGAFPLWSQRGEIFLVRGPQSFGFVRATTHPTVAFGPMVAVSSGNLAYPSRDVRWYDLTPDGQQSIWAVDEAGGDITTPQIQVVINWLEELKRKTRAK
jgi:hypothetical protein